MAINYHYPDHGVNATPISGRFLAHNRHDRVARAFLAADLFLGAARLNKPTLTQAALLAGINRTYAFWASRRMTERAAIEAGCIPLVPAPSVLPKTNGTMLTTPSTFTVPRSPDIDDVELIAIAQRVGPDRMLAAAVAAGH